MWMVELQKDRTYGPTEREAWYAICNCDRKWKNNWSFYTKVEELGEGSDEMLQWSAGLTALEQQQYTGAVEHSSSKV